MGLSCSPSCRHVIASNSSSSVPQPPGNATNPSDSAAITALRSCSVFTMRSSVRFGCATSLRASARGSTPTTSAPACSAASAHVPMSPTAPPPYTMPMFRRAMAVPSARAASRYLPSTAALDPANTHTRIMRPPSATATVLLAPAEDALESGVHVLRCEQLLHLGILREQRLEVLPLVPHPHRVALHDHVGRLPFHAA